MKLAKKPTNLVPEDTSTLTVEVLKATMPKRMRTNVTQGLVDTLNKLVTDPDERVAFRENLLSFTNVLQDPHVKMESYIHAVRYVTYKLMGMTNQDAWIRTFPDRYQRILDDGKSAAHLRATVSGYHKNKIVATVYEQALMPVHIVHADIFSKAVLTQADLMTDPSVSPMVRSQAATALLTHLKPPEARKLDLNVSVAEDDSLRELRQAITELAGAQKKAIEQGVEDAERVAASKLIEGESERVD
jgi:hypothetical protein